MPLINGDPPHLAGAVLQGMICTQHWVDGALDDAANVIYFRIHDRWHRLYFDFETVFWRSDVEVHDYPAASSPEEPFVNVDLGADLSLVGRTISRCSTEAYGEHDSKVTFHFAGGGSLCFLYIGESTSIEHSGLHGV